MAETDGCEVDERSPLVSPVKSNEEVEARSGNDSSRTPVLHELDRSSKSSWYLFLLTISLGGCVRSLDGALKIKVLISYFSQPPNCVVGGTIERIGKIVTLRPSRQAVKNKEGLENGFNSDVSTAVFAVFGYEQSAAGVCLDRRAFDGHTRSALCRYPKR